MPEVLFGEWLPDLPPHKNRGALVARNVMPTIESYVSLRAHSGFLPALSDRPVGSIWARSRSGVIYNFIGTRRGLFRVNNFDIEDLSQAGGYAVDNWNFALFGNRIIAVGGLDQQPQYYDMDSDPTVRFQDLPNAPNAKYVATIRDFLVLGHTRNAEGVVRPDLVVWSGFNNSEIWERSLTTQSDGQLLRGRGGGIQQLVSGAIGTVFEENSIWRMTYEGPPIVFRFDEVEIIRGTPAPNSVARLGFLVFFYSYDGFTVIDSRSGESTPIGANRVDRTFANRVSPSKIVNMRAVIYRRDFVVVWFYQSSSSSEVFDSYIAYNVKSQRWSEGLIDVSFVGEFTSGTVTLDDLDDLLNANIDTANFNVDSNAFPDGDIGVLVFDKNNVGGTFSGNFLPSEIDTAEFSQDNRVLFVNEVRPLIDGLAPNATITPITRDRLIDRPTIGQPSEINEIGNADVRVRARYHRYRIRSEQGFDHATGIEVTPKARGRR